jgi:hypothetical protein
LHSVFAPNSFSPWAALHCYGDAPNSTSVRDDDVVRRRTDVSATLRELDERACSTVRLGELLLERTRSLAWRSLVVREVRGPLSQRS